MANNDKTLLYGEEENVPIGGDIHVDSEKTWMSEDAGSSLAPTNSDEVLPEIADVRIEGVLGRGGMGVVYKGYQEYLDRPVAVKVLLSKNIENSQKFNERFQREAKILATLNHPHIVSCYQGGVGADGNCFLMMEYVEGSDLDKWVKEHGALPQQQALRIIEDIARALQHAQSHGIIHRDVKPENILLGTLGVAETSRFTADMEEHGTAIPFIPKLVDLGLARPSVAVDVQLTAQGAIMGTPATMAPEQFDDPDNVDERADIYGLGCVLYYALMGQPAFAGKTLGAIMETKLHRKAPDIRDHAPAMGTDIARLVQDLLCKEKTERIQNYDELLQRIASLRAGTVTASSKKLGLLVLGVVAVGILVVFLMQQDAQAVAGEHNTTEVIPVPNIPAVVVVADTLPAPLPVIELSDTGKSLADVALWTIDSPNWISGEDINGLAGYAAKETLARCSYMFDEPYFSYTATLDAKVLQQSGVAFESAAVLLEFDDGSEWRIAMTDLGEVLTRQVLFPAWTKRESIAGKLPSSRQWPLKIESLPESIKIMYATYTQTFTYKNMFEKGQPFPKPVALRIQIVSGSQSGAHLNILDPQIRYPRSP